MRYWLAMINALLLAGTCGCSKSGGEDWRKMGELPGFFNVETVGVDRNGLGIIGGYVDRAGTETPVEQRMMRRAAVVWRLENRHLEKVYAGDGWISSVDGEGDRWLAVAGALSGSGPGAINRLLASSDRARTWVDAGQVPLRGTVRVYSRSSARIYLANANSLQLSTDQGRSWSALPFPKVAERWGFQDWLALNEDGSLLAFGDGLMAMKPGASTWDTILGADYQVEAVCAPFVAAVVAGKALLFRMAPGGVVKIGELPAERLPKRIAAEGGVIRILTHPRNPEKLGFFGGGLNRELVRSADGGKSWRPQDLGSVQKADIAGSQSGLGVDVKNRVFGAR